MVHKTATHSACGLGTDRALDKAASSAEYIGRFLLQRGYTVTTLLEAQATRQAILEQLAHAKAELNKLPGTGPLGRGSSCLFVYFCGHGKVQKGDGNESGSYQHSEAG